MTTPTINHKVEISFWFFTIHLAQFFRLFLCSMADLRRLVPHGRAVPGRMGVVMACICGVSLGALAGFIVVLIVTI